MEEFIAIRNQGIRWDQVEIDISGGEGSPGESVNLSSLNLKSDGFFEIFFSPEKFKECYPDEEPLLLRKYGSSEFKR